VSNTYVSYKIDSRCSQFDRYYTTQPTTLPPANSTESISDPTNKGDDCIEHSDNGYSMAYMLVHIHCNEEAIRSSEINPHTELNKYLTDKLSSIETNTFKWWAMSTAFMFISDLYSILAPF